MEKAETAQLLLVGDRTPKSRMNEKEAQVETGEVAAMTGVLLAAQAWALLHSLSDLVAEVEETEAP